MIISFSSSFSPFTLGNNSVTWKLLVSRSGRSVGQLECELVVAG